MRQIPELAINWVNLQLETKIIQDTGNSYLCKLPYFMNGTYQDCENYAYYLEYGD